jgi:hypothetical protein
LHALYSGIDRTNLRHFDRTLVEAADLSDRNQLHLIATRQSDAAAGIEFSLDAKKDIADGLPPVPVPADVRLGFHPDDTTPIPRPSRYYGRRDNQLAQHFREERRQAERTMDNSARMPLSPAPPLAPGAQPALLPDRIDKSLLTIAEPKRLRDKAHLRFVASQPCLVCGRQPSDPHHLRFAQPRALRLKVSDEFTVPLCRGHHRQLHQAGNEVAWWENRKINAMEIAKGLWEPSHAIPTLENTPPE